MATLGAGTTIDRPAAPAGWPRSRVVAWRPSAAMPHTWTWNVAPGKSGPFRSNVPVSTLSPKKKRLPRGDLRTNRRFTTRPNDGGSEYVPDTEVVPIGRRGSTRPLMTSPSATKGTSSVAAPVKDRGDPTASASNWTAVISTEVVGSPVQCTIEKSKAPVEGCGWVPDTPPEAASTVATFPCAGGSG